MYLLTQIVPRSLSPDYHIPVYIPRSLWDTETPLYSHYLRAVISFLLPSFPPPPANSLITLIHYHPCHAAVWKHLAVQQDFMAVLREITPTARTWQGSWGFRAREPGGRRPAALPCAPAGPFPPRSFPRLAAGAPRAARPAGRGAGWPCQGARSRLPAPPCAAARGPARRAACGHGGGEGGRGDQPPSGRSPAPTPRNYRSQRAPRRRGTTAPEMQRGRVPPRRGLALPAGKRSLSRRAGQAGTCGPHTAPAPCPLPPRPPRAAGSSALPRPGVPRSSLSARGGAGRGGAGRGGGAAPAAARQREASAAASRWAGALALSPPPSARRVGRDERGRRRRRRLPRMKEAGGGALGLGRPGERSLVAAARPVPSRAGHGRPPPPPRRAGRWRSSRAPVRRRPRPRAVEPAPAGGGRRGRLVLRRRPRPRPVPLGRDGGDGFPPPPPSPGRGWEAAAHLRGGSPAGAAAKPAGFRSLGDWARLARPCSRAPPVPLARWPLLKLRRRARAASREREGPRAAAACPPRRCRAPDGARRPRSAAWPLRSGRLRTPHTRTALPSAGPLRFRALPVAGGLTES